MYVLRFSSTYPDMISKEETKKKPKEHQVMSSSSESDMPSSSPPDKEPSSDYIPTSSPSSSDDDSEPEPQDYQTLHSDEKYIIFKECLNNLLTWCHCPSCGSQDINLQQSTTSGTLLNVIL